MRHPARPWYSRGVRTLLNVLVCLAIPWVWGAIVSKVYSRIDRRGPGLQGQRPPTDYSI